MFRLASFDIGRVNFASYVQDTDMKIVKQLEEEYSKLPKTKKRRVRGKMNPEIESILHKMFLTGKRIKTGVYNFSSGSKYLDMVTRENTLTYLRKNKELWDSCDVFIIEEQFFRTFRGKGKKGKGSEANIGAIKLAELVLTWYLDNYPFKTTMYFDSTYKTQILGAPVGLSKPQRKAWAVKKCREIYELRDDKEMAEIFLLKDRIFRKRITTDEKVQFYLDTFPGKQKDTKQLAKKIVTERHKLDDIADAMVQCQAFIFKYFIACF